MFARFLPVFSEPWNRREKGGKELVPPFCLYGRGVGDCVTNEKWGCAAAPPYREDPPR